MMLSGTAFKWAQRLHQRSSTHSTFYPRTARIMLLSLRSITAGVDAWNNTPAGVCWHAHTLGWSSPCTSHGVLGSSCAHRRPFGTDAVLSGLPHEPTADQAYHEWRQDPDTYWERCSEHIDWYEADPLATTSTAPAIRSGDDLRYPRWFAGRQVNACFNAVDRHLGTRPDQPAVIFDSAVSDEVTIFTYAQLHARVAKLAAAMLAQGLSPGDTCVIYMPMVPEAMEAMLACARIGVTHCVVFGGFASAELASRLRDVQPKLVMTASCGVEPSHVVEFMPLLESAVEQSGVKPNACVVLQRPQHTVTLDPDRHIEWSQFVQSAGDTLADCVPVPSEHPLYVLHTSGTTGRPKGVVRSTGDHLVALSHSMRRVFCVDPGEVFWAASDLGWVVGHSYILYAPLIRGCTTVLYEGKPVGTPDCGSFFRVITDHNVSTFFTAPTALRAIKALDPHGHTMRTYAMKKLRAIFLAGERADPDTVRWVQQHTAPGVAVVDHWWQTELGCPAVSCGAENSIRVGSAGKPLPGYSFTVVDDEHNVIGGDGSDVNGSDDLRASSEHGGDTKDPQSEPEVGRLLIKLPLPPGTMTTLWDNTSGFEGYFEDFPGFYETGDAGCVDNDGYVHIMSRTDDVINTAGHRLSTGALEEVVADHPEVAEAAVIGAYDALKGQLPVGFVVLNQASRDDQLERRTRVVAEVIASVRERIGPVAAFKSVCVVPRLPKTRSGKCLRVTLRRIADGDVVSPPPPTIDDPAILNEIASALKGVGWPEVKSQPME